jgi:hypothetical protein
MKEKKPLYSAAASGTFSVTLFPNFLGFQDKPESLY